MTKYHSISQPKAALATASHDPCRSYLVSLRVRFPTSEASSNVERMWEWQMVGPFQIRRPRIWASFGEAKPLDALRQELCFLAAESSIIDVTHYVGEEFIESYPADTNIMFGVFQNVLTCFNISNACSVWLTVQMAAGSNYWEIGAGLSMACD